jgi:K+-sensing histidine kinase KdpD
MGAMRTDDDERLRSAMGLAFAILAPVAVAVLLVPIRSDVDNANLALVLVLVVVAAAILGGRRAGAVAAVVATFSFDFFLTEPYLSMHVESSDDVETVLILLGVGLLVGAVASRGRRAARERERARTRCRRDRARPEGRRPRRAGRAARARGRSGHT